MDWNAFHQRLYGVGPHGTSDLQSGRPPVSDLNVELRLVCLMSLY